MNRQHLIGKLRHTQGAMRETARLMRESGIEHHAAEMDGAAKIIDTWVDGIRGDTAPGVNPWCFDLSEGASGVPVGGKVDPLLDPRLSLEQALAASGVGLPQKDKQEQPG
jgi:hypothetical protein